MLIRVLLLGSVALSCAGCAGDSPLRKALGAPSLTTPALAAPAPGEIPRRTMSDKVLAAIALERVTGLKPDPSRLTSN